MSKYKNKDKYARAVVNLKEAKVSDPSQEQIDAEYVKLGGRIEGVPRSYRGDAESVLALDEEIVHEKSGREVESLPKPGARRGRPRKA